MKDKENSPPRSKAEGKHQCETCGKVFHVESRLKRHVATHTGNFHSNSVPFIEISILYL